jgi:hypothetical protein
MKTSKTNTQFTINLPEGWEDRTVHLFTGPDDSGVQHMLNLTIDAEVQNYELNEYARERIDQIIDTVQGVEILKEEEKTLPNGNRAYECVYKWIPADETIIFKKLVYMIIDGMGYTFSANFSKKTIKTIGVEVDGIIDSLVAGAARNDEE